jgi:hypothetical protein
MGFHRFFRNIRFQVHFLTAHSVKMAGDKGPRQISAHRPIARFKPFLAFLIPKAMIFSAFDGLATWFPRRNPLFTGVH